MKWRTLKIIALVALANIFVFGSCTALIFNCPIPFGDGAIGIKGVAYEWIDAPTDATSQIYISNVELPKDIESTLENTLDMIPAQITKIPLENVEISVGSNSSIYYSFTSNSTGQFGDFQIAAPGRYSIRLKVSKSGYMEVYQDVSHGDTFYHVVVAVLVKTS